jgi:hypothetical protein
MSQPTVAVILLNWNGKQDTLACLESLRQVDYADFTTIVVDNGSNDGSVPAIRSAFPAVTILETGQNLGFSGGNNVGIRYALANKFDYLLLLNNDTVVAPDILKVLIATSQTRPDAGFLGAKIYFHSQPDRLWYAGARWLPDRADCIHVGGGQIDDGRQWADVQETDYACGCALFAQATTIRDVGLLETSFFALWEEVDWCYRARRKGYKSLFVPDAKVWHKISASFDGGANKPHYEYYYWRNRLLWMERNLPFAEIIRLYRRVLIPKIRAEWRAYRNPTLSPPERLGRKARLLGVWHYFIRRFGKAPDSLLSVKRT